MCFHVDTDAGVKLETGTETARTSAGSVSGGRSRGAGLVQLSSGMKESHGAGLVQLTSGMKVSHGPGLVQLTSGMKVVLVGVLTSL